MVSSKVRRPAPLDKLVRVRDLLAVNRALLSRIEAVEREVMRLRERDGLLQGVQKLAEAHAPTA